MFAGWSLLPGFGSCLSLARMTDSTSQGTRSGAEIFADAVAALGFKHVLSIPGEGILEMIDALSTRHPQIRQTTFRHEGGMTYATLAIGQISGEPALCLVARAPGALNTALALHTADTDAAPMVMVIGQTAFDQAERDRMSGFEFSSVFGPISKEVMHVTDASRIPEMLSRAWHRAASGRMGPVVLVVPENLMHQQSDAKDARRPVIAASAPSASQLDSLKALVANAKGPLIVVGGTGWTDEGLASLTQFAKASGWPVATTYRRSHLFDNTDSQYAGELGIGIDPALFALTEKADLVVAVNVRLGELNTFGPGGFGGFKALQASASRKLVHVHAESELQKVSHADIAIASGPNEFMRAIGDVAMSRCDGAWTQSFRDARTAFMNSGASPGPVDLRQVFKTLRKQLPAETVVAVGAGAYAVWLHRYFDFIAPHTLVGPKSGAMGYGLSAAIGASLLDPSKTVVDVAGDGCFMMHPEELATAVQNEMDLLVLLINNDGYGAIRASQQRMFGRTVGTDLRNPNFVSFAQSFGAHAALVTKTDEFEGVLKDMLSRKGVRLIEVQTPASLSKPQ